MIPDRCGRFSSIYTLKSGNTKLGIDLKWGWSRCGSTPFLNQSVITPPAFSGWLNENLLGSNKYS